MASASGKRAGLKPDIASFAGLVLAVGGIMAGLIMEGGSVKDVAQITSALIVLGGTLGAVMVTTPLKVLLGAFKRLGLVFMEQSQSPADTIREIIGFATKARRQGIVSLEQEAGLVQDPFLRKALNLAVDGIDLQQIRSIMELEITMME